MLTDLDLGKTALKTFSSKVVKDGQEKRRRLQTSESLQVFDPAMEGHVQKGNF